MLVQWLFRRDEGRSVERMSPVPSGPGASHEAGGAARLVPTSLREVVKGLRGISKNNI